MSMLEQVVLYSIEKKDVDGLLQKRVRTFLGLLRGLAEEAIENVEGHNLKVKQWHEKGGVDIVDFIIANADEQGMARFQFDVNSIANEQRGALYLGINYEHSSFRQYPGGEAAARQNQISHQAVQVIAVEFSKTLLKSRIPHSVYFFTHRDGIGQDERTKGFY